MSVDVCYFGLSIYFCGSDHFCPTSPIELEVLASRTIDLTIIPSAQAQFLPQTANTRVFYTAVVSQRTSRTEE
jgi:hypothetical protein